MCEELGGEFVENLETTEIGYFAEDELPPLSTLKNNEDQIRMCFEAHRAKYWKTLFD